MEDKNTGVSKPFRRILLCTDFSENADFAFEYALGLASASKSELHLLHIVPETEAQFWKSYIYEVEDVDRKAKQDIDSAINERYRYKLPEGLPLTVCCRVGKESREILEYAEEQHIDLIVIGREGHSALGTALFGKITEKIARHAECAVLIIPLSYKKQVEKKNA
jgi:nucleotide-binding universal stress UspA family protein